MNLNSTMEFEDVDYRDPFGAARGRANSGTKPPKTYF